MFIPLIILALGLAFAIAGLRMSKSMRHLQRQRRRNLRVWRRQHGIRVHHADGAPPMPFYVSTKLGDPGDPRTGISTEDTDNFLAMITRIFARRDEKT
jgi:hypothetical protein